MLKVYKKFVADKYAVCCLIFAIILGGFHVYQLIDTGGRIEPLIRVIFCAVSVPCLFFFRRESVPYLYLIFAFTLEQFAHFSNYTAFFIISLFLILHKRATLPVILIYIVDVVIVCEHHDKTAIHLIIHFLNCALIYFCVQIIFKIAAQKIKASQKKLILDDTDRHILAQLSKGALQKEIEGLSENTVSKRLKRMRERNFCETNAELLLIFMSE